MSYEKTAAEMSMFPKGGPGISYGGPYGGPNITLAPPPAVPQGHLLRHISRTDDATARVYALLNMTEDLGDRLYGPRPEGTTAGNDAPGPISVMGQMECSTEALHSALDRLANAVGRLREL